MPLRHRPGVTKYSAIWGGWVGNKAIALKEKDSNEKPSAGAGLLDMELCYNPCSRTHPDPRTNYATLQRPLLSLSLFFQ